MVGDARPQPRQKPTKPAKVPPGALDLAKRLILGGLGFGRKRLFMPRSRQPAYVTSFPLAHYEFARLEPPAEFQP